MKKSSLGRRSSVVSQGRSSSTRFGSVEGKKSSIPKPCSGPSKPGRSSSVERDSVARDPQQFGLRRSKSYLGLDLSRPSSCFMTPVQSHARSTNAYRTHMSEGGRSSSAGRLSSFGGGKSAKKESRPIADKNFQIEAQAKITEFFNKEDPELLEKGSIKPMTTAMFIDLVNFILRKHVFGLVINRNNLVDEVMRFCKTYHYRGKAEKSWLCTVNAPHSWPSVVGFLVWLVDWHKLAQSFDPFTACYPEHDEGGVEMQDYDFRNLVPCLLSGYNLNRRKNPPGDDSKEMEKYLVHYRNVRGVDESEMKKLNQEYYQLQEELNSFNAEDTTDIEKIEDLEKQKKTIRDEMRQMKKFIYESEEYMKNAQEKISKSQFHIQTCKTNEAELNAENKRLRTTKSEQTMSSEERKEIESQMASLQNDIQLLSQDIEAYQNGAYKEDLELVSQRRVFDNSIRDYNRLVSLNLVLFPELKNTLIDATLTKCMDAPDAAERFVRVDEDLNELKLHRNSQLNALDLEIESIEVTRRTNENELLAKQEQLEKCREDCGNWKMKLERMVDKEKQGKDQFNVAKARVMENIDNEEENLEKLDKCAFDYETQKINLENQLEKKLQAIEEFKKNVDEAFNMRLDNVEMYNEKLYKGYSDCIERRKVMVREILGEEYLHESNQNINGTTAITNE